MATESVTQEFPLIILVGPTASGKTSLAITLAEKFGGEIICADSRTVYRDMDIGTAKPTAEERARVPHWGLDLAAPGERFTAADFQRYAYAKIDEIRARRRVPFLVGGTGLYVDSVMFGYEFGGEVDDAFRATLSAMTIAQLQVYCFERNIELPENSTNKRYLIRAIEQKGVNHKRKQQPISLSKIVGIATDRDILRTRIERRAEQLFDDGVVDEAIKLGKKYGWESEAMTGNIYPLVRQYMDENLSLQEMQHKFVTLDWRLAKRQLTWLRRNPYIQWKSLEEAEHYLSEVLAHRASS